MTDRTFLPLGCAATALVLLFATYRVCAADAEPRDYYSSYKTPVPLTLDTERVAVLAPGIRDEQDLAEVESARADALERALRALIAAGESRAPPAWKTDSMTAEELDQLRALGYTEEGLSREP